MLMVRRPHATPLLFSLAVISIFAFGVVPVAGAQVPDELVNGGFETPGSTQQTAFDWQFFETGYQRVQNSHGGSWSIRLRNTSSAQQSGAYQRIDVQQTERKPIFIGGYVKGRDIVNTQGGYLGASLYVEIYLQDGSVVYWNSIANFGTFPWRWIGFNTGTLATVDQPIDHVFVVPILAGATGTAWFDDIAVTEFNPANTAVTLMFDDGGESTYTQAGPVLAANGFAGSMAIITSEIGEPGFMSLSQIKSLANVGWEVVSHGLTHSDLSTLSRDQLLDELRRSKRILERSGFIVRNFALPFGAYNGAILAEGAKYYRSLRAYELGDNPQGVFPYDVKVRSAIAGTTVQEVEGWLNEAIANQRWEVIVFHSIAETGDDVYHVAPGRFGEIIAAVVQSGVSVVTYDEGINRFAVSP